MVEGLHKRCIGFLYTSIGRFGGLSFFFAFKEYLTYTLIGYPYICIYIQAYSRITFAHKHPTAPYPYPIDPKAHLPSCPRSADLQCHLTHRPVDSNADIVYDDGHQRSCVSMIRGILCCDKTELR
jgi:hypothetical protein